MKIPAHAKYQIIYDTVQKNNNLLNVAAMCEIAGVSRSGYYHYLSTEDQRMEREEQDRQDFLLILKAYQYRGYHKGARSIYMRLLHMEPLSFSSFEVLMEAMMLFMAFFVTIWVSVLKPAEPCR